MFQRIIRHAMAVKESGTLIVNTTRPLLCKSTFRTHAAKITTSTHHKTAPTDLKTMIPIAPLTAKPTSLTSAIKLLSGHDMPVVGLGTWRAAPGEVGSAVYEALQCGYRAIDGAAVYQNEVEVGAAIQKWLTETGHKRESLFITSKLWNVNHEPKHVETALRRTLSQLNLEYLDLYLIHWPVSFLHHIDEKGELELYPKTKKGVTLFTHEDVPLEHTWEALLSCQRKGLIRSIGVSNCTSDQVLDLNLKFGTSGPCVNQVESHPFCAQRTMQQKLSLVGISLTAYSPLGNIHAAPPSAGIKASATATPPPPSPLQHPTIVNIAAAHGVTPAQVLLRWNLQLGRVIIPKSVRPQRIRENSQLFHFDLSEADMTAIELLNHPPTQYRYLNPTSFKRTPRKYFFTAFE